jgi:hypothetical protein
MTWLIFVLILIPSGLFISLFVSDYVNVQFSNHGTKASLVFAALSTLSRLILFLWMPAFDSLVSSRTVMADFLHVLLLPDEVITFPIFTFVTWAGGRMVPVFAWIPYLFVIYFTIFRIVGKWTEASGPYIPSKRKG